MQAAELDLSQEFTKPLSDDVVRAADVVIAMGCGDTCPRGRATWIGRLRYPGVQRVEHAYFFAPHAVDDDTRQQYLQRAYDLGSAFDTATGDAPRAAA
jgi:hypothetical protein